MQPEFWRGKRVFITGHTGFKGSWLALWLREMGAQVTGYALDPPTEPSHFVAAGVASGIEDLRGDVRNFADLREALENRRPEIVMHMAAQSLVREAYRQPMETYATNVMGVVHLLEAVRHAREVKAAVVVTSDKCYENLGTTRAFREGDPLGGLDPYSSSKGAAEIVASAYRHSYFNGGPGNSGAAVATVRAGNVIGGGDWARDRLVPDAMRAFGAALPLRLRNPAAIRPWQHVLDPISGYLTLAERLCTVGKAYAEAWNFGPDTDAPESNEKLVERLAQAWGSSARWERDGAGGPHESEFLMLDSSKSRARLGWVPRLHLDQAVNWTVEWYSAYKRGADMAALSRQHLKRYQSDDTEPTHG